MKAHDKKIAPKTFDKSPLQTVQFKDQRPENTTQLKAQQMANPIIQRQENKTGMPNNLKSGIENLSGIDMSDVNVHYNSSQPAQLKAHAFAQGNQIHLGPGQERHLPHEAWHVVQQKQGRVAPTMQLKGKVNINDDSGLEKEADVMGAKAMSVIQKKENVKRHNNVLQPIYQLVIRNPGDLDYGFSGARGDAMDNARATHQEHRGTSLPTVDHLNASAGVTHYMDGFHYHTVIRKIAGYDKTSHQSLTGSALTGISGTETENWIDFLKDNIDLLRIKHQVGTAIAASTPTQALDDHLQKNAYSGTAPQKDSIRQWYQSGLKPSNSTEFNNLKTWVWSAFFRVTSKLGLEFAHKYKKAIHFNITHDAYRGALARRRIGAGHHYEAITHSELRHLKRLQDRGKAPEVHFQENTGGVHDVASPFHSLDMLNSTGVKKLLQTPQWKSAAVDYEVHLGAYAANNRADAKSAVQGALNKMDDVLRLRNNSRDITSYRSHREVFGQKVDTSAGQVGDDPETIRTVIKGGGDVNMREQMTAIFNAGLWHSRRSTINSILQRIGQIKDASERKDKAAKIGISEDQINDINTIIKSQIAATKSTLIDITNLRGITEAHRQKEAERLLGVTEVESAEIVRIIPKIHAIARSRSGKSGRELDELNSKIQALLDELSEKFTKINILETPVDTDESRSRTTRIPRGSADKLAHKKSAQDYTDMKVPLSPREKASITGGVPDPLAKLPWEEGLAVFSINEDTGWGKQMKEAGIPTVAGNSGTAARLLKIYQWLGLSHPLNFRLGIMGWMLPSRDHSLYEIMNGAKSVGVSGPGEDITNPIKMYQTIDPVTKAELLANVADHRKFPESVALEKVSDTTYKDLIKQS